MILQITKLLLLLSTTACFVFSQTPECVEPELIPTLYLKGLLSKRCVGVHGYNMDEGGIVDIWDCVRGARNEIWKFKFNGAVTPTNDKLYQLIATSSGKCLTAGGGGANNINVTQTECQTSAASQLWYPKINQSDPFHFQMIGSETNRCLTTLGTFNGARVVLYDCLLGMNNQLWFSDV